MSSNPDAKQSRGRVNITLELETGGAAEKKELPLKLLVLGAFDPTAATQPLHQTERHPVRAETFDLLLNTVAPSLRLDVPEGSVDLNFNALKDFSPQSIAEQVPRTRQLLAMRNCLKDLKSLISDNPKLQRNLQKQLTEE